MPKVLAAKISKVKKRSGDIVDFDKNKIINAVNKAIAAVEGKENLRAAKKVADRVVRSLNKKFNRGDVPGVEEIQDLVEESLIKEEMSKVAKAYILYRSERAKVRAARAFIPKDIRRLAQESKKYFRNELSEFIYYRTYSRWLYDEGRRETWIETVERYINFMRENLGRKLTDKEYEEVENYILNQKAMPSMRLLWSAGAAARKTNVSAYNCSYIAPSRLEDFAEVMYLSMCGAGVGFSVESQTIQELPIIKFQTGKKLPAHIIEDSKEGWGNALTLGFKTWYEGNDVDFDFSKVRPAGSRLVTMGGQSSGPEPLRSLLEFARKKILSRQGKRLTNIDAHDILCKIGEVVVMGGVRRSAMVSLSDLDDEAMRHAKQGYFYMLEPQRQMANNSAAYNKKPSATEFMDEWLALAKSGTGERGIFNRGGLKYQLPERRWKTFEKHWYTAGTNPCVTSDTWVMTSRGARQVKDLINKSFNAVVDGKLYKSSGFFITGYKRIFGITTKRGFSLSATPNHKVLVVGYKSRKVQRNIWKEVKDLVPGDRIVLHNHKKFSWIGWGTEKEGWLLGNLLGDGNIQADGYANLDYWGATQPYMMNYARTLIHQSVGARSDLTGYVAKTGYARVGSANLGKLAYSYGMTHGRKVVNRKVEMSSYNFYRGFLRGWFDADGSIQGNHTKGVSVRLASSNLSNILIAQRMLARMGIISTLYKNRRNSSWRMLPDGRGGYKNYLCRADHELIITESNIYAFSERVGFSDPEKKAKLNKKLNIYKRKLNQESFSTIVTSVVPTGMKEVYDCQVLEANAFDANGLYIHNCGEIVLRSKQFCNLSEVVCRAEDTKETLLKKVRVASILGTYQSTLTNFSYLSGEWKRNCDEERLLGVSLTGQWDSPAVRDPEVLKALRDEAVKVNQEYARRFGVNPSACVTCVKPSGTVSQLVDAASGMHPRHAKYYIRRVRISANDPLFHMLRDQKFRYYPEVGQTVASASTYVLEFPVKAPDVAVTKDNLTSLDQLGHWKMVKENYTEHNPSVTVSVGDEEWLAAANWLYENWNTLGGLSFLPRDNHTYALAPYEEIDEKKYNEMEASMPKIDFSQILYYEKEDATQGSKELACVGGICEIQEATEPTGAVAA